VGVADIMKEAGLTHGGFYAHFPSRAALVVEALERAGAESARNTERAAADPRLQGASVFQKLVLAYLSDAHLKAVEQGCPVAALVTKSAPPPPSRPP
jgi:AcrR family transcriptional regulator